MTAKQILEMIEKVSPEDTKALDEIDARVWCHVRRATFHRMLLYFDGDRAYLWSVNPREPQCIGSGATQYTRSRDALKAIRPDGWEFLIGQVENQFCANLNDCDEEGFSSGLLPTEELAELHAIIQAIEFERNGK